MKVQDQKNVVFFACFVIFLLFLTFLPPIVTPINKVISQENYSPWTLDWEKSNF